MPRKLRNEHGSGTVTLPKEDLRLDGLVDEDGELVETQAAIQRLGSRCYVVRIPDTHGDLPSLEETRAIKRLAAEQALDLSAGRQARQADD
jgi:predicted alpha/beta-hydrolase family hydrolase